MVVEAHIQYVTEDRAEVLIRVLVATRVLRPLLLECVLLGALLPDVHGVLSEEHNCIERQLRTREIANADTGRASHSSKFHFRVVEQVCGVAYDALRPYAVDDGHAERAQRRFTGTVHPAAKLRRHDSDAVYSLHEVERFGDVLPELRCATDVHAESYRDLVPLVLQQAHHVRDRGSQATRANPLPPNNKGRLRAVLAQQEEQLGELRTWVLRPREVFDQQRHARGLRRACARPEADARQKIEGAQHGSACVARY